MSHLVNKLISKLMILFVVILFIAGFKQSILTDASVSAVFGRLMGSLPFAGLLADVICKIMKYNYEIPLITSSRVVSDFLKLAVMACIQPLITGFFSLLFLRLPPETDGDPDAQEKYMNSLPYKCKEALLTIISAPLIALAAAYLTTSISDYLNQSFGPIMSVVFGVLAVIGISAVSLIPLLVGGVTIGVAILWRLVVTLLSKMATTFMTNALCLWIYAAFLSAEGSQILISIFALAFWLIVADFAVRNIQRVIVS